MSTPNIETGRVILGLTLFRIVSTVELFKPINIERSFEIPCNELERPVRDQVRTYTNVYQSE
jgi:hypothetical protein